MKILYGKTFGLGNAVMAIPALKALQEMGHDVTVACGNTPDDTGALEVFNRCGVRTLQYGKPSPLIEYDLAIMAIPFDGRWQHGVHFNAKRVMDGRTRPDPSTTGLISWKKHEAEYQMDNVRELGFTGKAPDCSFARETVAKHDSKRVYLGIGYKRDRDGFWKVKHWGNDNYVQLVKLLLESDPKLEVWTSGDNADMVLTFVPIARALNFPKRFQFKQGSITQMFKTVADCDVYVGNDTGTMHVAASFDKPCVGLFFMAGARIKNHPLCSRWTILEGHEYKPTTTEVFDAAMEYLK